MSTRSAQAVPVVTESGQTVLILKEGTTQSRGKEAQRNNINAAKAVAEILKSCLGPRGMDKMLIASFGDATITNDGATILKEMDVQHPAAKMMVEVAKTTDQEVGDGTTSVVAFTAAIITGTTMGRKSMGSIISRARVFMAKAENRVPTAAKPRVANTMIRASRGKKRGR